MNKKIQKEEETTILINLFGLTITLGWIIYALITHNWLLLIALPTSWFGIITLIVNTSDRSPYNE